jgi:transposase InsO family protein
MHAQCCNSCQHIKDGVYRSYKKSGKMKLFTATAPFQQISVDIVGPLPTSHSMNRYIVSMIDKFSRYCMLVPVKSISSSDIIKAIDRWITTFGAPKSILSDNGPQFISGGIELKYSSTYYPQSNGQIERLHRWIKERLTLIAYDGANSTPNQMTTYSPMDIVLGVDDYAFPEYRFDPELPGDYIKYMENRQRIIRNDANHIESDRECYGI